MGDLHLPCFPYVPVIMFLLIVTCITTEASLEIKTYFHRAHRKLKNGVVVEQHVFRSKLECVTTCASRSFCKGASWGIRNKECLLTARNTLDHGKDNPSMSAAVNWVTMAEHIYPVALYRSPDGPMTHAEAKSLCAQLNTIIASTSDLLLARSMGYEMCVCGWLEDGTNGFVMQTHVSGCWQTFTTGIHKCNGLSNVYCRPI